MKFTWIGENTGTFPVTGLNRSAMEGELQGNADWQSIGIWGMCIECYNVVDGSLTPLSESEVDDIEAEKVKASNAAAAASNQLAALTRLQENQVRLAHGLPPVMSDQDELDQENYVQLLQGDIDNPSTDPVYNPPLPPGVNPPPYQTLTVVVDRVDGWEGNLGFRAVITSMTDEFIPTNLALSVYSAEECTGYLYTTGAFQEDTETGEWYAICPPGQEPGDVDVHLGILYGAAELGCFTLPQGQTQIVVNVYESE